MRSSLKSAVVSRHFLLALALSGAGCGAPGAAEDSSSRTGAALDAQGTYTLTLGGRCLDVAGISKDDGAQVWSWTCWGGPNQEWTLQPVNGDYELVSVSSGKCLDVPDGDASTPDGTRLQQWSCWGGDNQLFSLEDVGGAYRLHSKATSKCVDTWADHDGAVVQVWDCNAGQSQRWQLNGVGQPPPAGGNPTGKLVTNEYWLDYGAHAPALGMGNFSVQTVTPTRAPFGVPESTVYFTSLVHQQDSDTGWEIRLGKGSQIYSILTSRGDIVTEQPDVHSLWMDQVLQPVLSWHSPQPTYSGGRYFIQAGTYTAADQGLDLPYYAPMLGAELDAPSATFHTVVWPQQPEVENNIPWRSEFLLQQDVRDVGDGVIELSYYYTNFGGDTIDFFDLPWGAFVHNELGNLAMSDASGAWSWAPSSAHYEDADPHFYVDTSGWLALAESAAVDSWGLGVVFGNQRIDDENQQSSFIRVGTASDGTKDTTILEAIHQWNQMQPGDSFFFRYYLIVNHLEPQIHAYGNDLRANVQGGVIHFDYEDAGLVDPCAKAGDAPFTGCDGFYGLDRPADGARPILLLRSVATGRLVVATSPYALSDQPYLGNSTEYVALLGWGLPVQGDAPPHDGLVKLSSVLTDGAELPQTDENPDVWVAAR